jgi:two-component system OmpR family sensor kinase
MSKDSDDVSRPQNLDSVKTRAAAASPHNERDCDRSISELLQAVRAREDFISVAAHELRNPITPIQLCVGLIRTAVATGDYAKVAAELARLERLLERFLKRTEVLLNVTQLASGKLHLEAAETNLSELAHDVIEGLRPLLTRSGSPLAVEIAPAVIGVIDAVAFNQILDNLLSNAIKYGAGRLIELQLDVIDDRARLRVRDHGAGIAGEDQARIFESFERAVRKTNQTGFGLGLWVTRRLVAAMGGTITVSSGEGTGSLFTVTIPLNSGKTDG